MCSNLVWRFPRSLFTAFGIFVISPSLSPLSSAPSLKITSNPPGANVELDGSSKHHSVGLSLGDLLNVLAHFYPRIQSTATETTTRSSSNSKEEATETQEVVTPTSSTPADSSVPPNAISGTPNSPDVSVI